MHVKDNNFIAINKYIRPMKNKTPFPISTDVHWLFRFNNTYQIPLIKLFGKYTLHLISL